VVFHAPQHRCLPHPGPQAAEHRQEPKAVEPKIFGSVRLQLSVVKEVGFKPEQVQDLHAISHDEVLMWNELKMKCLDLASLYRTIVWQHSCLMFLREGDANTRFSFSKHVIEAARTRSRSSCITGYPLLIKS
jgi:hypothetical protein